MENAGYAVVARQQLSVFEAPYAAARQVDEVLYGMPVTLLQPPEDGWCRVRTPWGSEGYLAESGLWSEGAQQWQALGKMAARAPFVDVLAAAGQESERLATLPRGGLVHPVGEVDDEGWLPVELPDRQRGFVKTGNMMPQMTHWKNTPEDKLREALGTTALSYLGAQYRSGGRSPMGIDAGGLVMMAYLLNGSMVCCRPELCEGFDLAPVPREKLGMGDVLYFAGHVAMYLGDERYVHASPQNGSDGVVINSLDAASPFYREDLAKGIVACGSLFG